MATPVIPSDPAAPRAMRALFVVLVALTAVYEVAIVAGAGKGDGLRTWLLPVLLAGAAVACFWRAGASEDRWAWRLLGLSMVAWALGELTFGLWSTRGGRDPAVSIADVPWLLQYPLSAVALAVFLRRRAGRLGIALRIDALIGALAVGAVAGAVVASVPLDGDGLVEHLISVAYPAGDVLLLVFIAGTFAVGGAALSSTWWLLAASFAVQVVTDFAYMQKTAAGVYEAGTWTDFGWPGSAVLLALAALRARDSQAALIPGGRLGPGLLFGTMALAVVVADHAAGLPSPVLALAALALALVTVRMALTVRENARLLDTARDEALTDALTGLGNRRALLRDLESPASAVLALFDLNGFKRYNDVFGHPAGDELLRRLAARLADAAATRPGTRAYRLGGDEFCLLADGPAEHGPDVAALGCAALSTAGEAFAVSSSVGWACAPADGGAAVVLGEADRRMYRDKQGGRPTSSRQTAMALMAAVQERHPDLGDHSGEVAELAARVAIDLGLDPVAVDEVREAAVLHDVGKLGIPDAILSKPGALDDDEWTFMRRHTLIGERIVLAAPDLVGVAAIVRSSHERFDGGGYPDGLAGDAVPLGSRIVAVCDAFDAIVADRPYRPARTREEALAELRRCAGSQFDPRVVAAFEGVLALTPSTLGR